jgi:hypothetical protein
MSSVLYDEDLSAVVAEIREGSPIVRPAAIIRLAEFLEKCSLQNAAILACLGLVEDGTIGAEELRPHFPLMLRAWDKLHAELQGIHQKPASEWIVDDDYTDTCDSTGVVLDLFGYLPDEGFLSALRTGSELPEPLLKVFALISLIRRGETVDAAQIDLVATNNETRILLWRRLREFGKTQLMPERWATSEQLAASDLVWWASHPNEIGTPPEEIELMVIFSVDLEGEELEVFLFRFREYPKPWAPSQGWMAGIAGPFRDGESLGSPWSAFDAWDSISPDKHFKKLIKNACWCEIDDDECS